MLSILFGDLQCILITLGKPSLKVSLTIFQAKDFSSLFIQINVVLHNTSLSCHTTASMKHALGFRKMVKDKAADDWCLICPIKRVGTLYSN